MSTPTARKRTREDADRSSSPDLSSSDEPLADQVAKKTRTEGGEVQRERDEEFWFEDGSVILVARNMEFRVYMRVLADHSPVFADMFSLPQPPRPAPSPAADECPIVHLADSPEDLRHILRVLLPRKDVL